MFASLPPCPDATCLYPWYQQTLLLNICTFLKPLKIIENERSQRGAFEHVQLFNRTLETIGTFLVQTDVSDFYHGYISIYWMVGE